MIERGLPPARAPSDGVKDRGTAPTAKRRWGSRFFSARAPARMDGLPPACRKKWWGPVILEAGAVPVPRLKDLREEVWQRSRGLDAPWSAMILARHVPKRPSDIAPDTRVDKKRTARPNGCGPKVNLDFVVRCQVSAR